MTMRRPLLLLLLAACGPGTEDTEPVETTSGDTGAVSMSSNPSEPSTLDPTLPPNPTTATTATTVPPDPTTATTVPPDPTTTTATVTTVQPTSETETFGSFTFSETDVSASATFTTAFTTTFTTESDTDNTFIVETDLPLPGDCDVFLEDCSAGEKCMPFAAGGAQSWNSTKCVPVMPNAAAPGEPCFVEDSGVSGVDNCEFHAMCFNVDPDTLQGECVAMCTGSEANPVCPPGSGCLLANDGVLALCLPTCDPLDVQSCSPGQVCATVTLDFQCIFDASGDDGDFTDTCEFVNGCDPGFACIEAGIVPQCDAQDPGCCSPHCDLDGPNLCPPGTGCVAWFEQGQAPPGQEDVGVCATP